MDCEVQAAEHRIIDISRRNNGWELKRGRKSRYLEEKTSKGREKKDKRVKKDW